MRIPAILERLRSLDTSVVSDVMDEAGLPNHALSGRLRPLDPRMRVAGIALCATGRPRIHATQPGASGVSMYELERQAASDTVLVVDAGSENVGAVIGGFMAATLKAKGCAGLIVNGNVRDAAELCEMGLPTFCRGTSPVNAARRWELSGVGVPVSMPGMNGAVVSVAPGDFLLGDADGLVVIPAGHAESLIDDSARLQSIEESIRNDIRNGATREQAFARHPRFAHIRRVAAAA
jgi:regulator of RNase E activity RraA